MTFNKASIIALRQGGFSLIELAIVIILIALLSAPLLQRYKIFQAQEKLDNTNVALNTVNNALGEFFIKNGRYPCPSDRALGFGTAGHGTERCTQADALGNNACAAGNGLCKVTGTGANFVFSGGVPYATLGIPFQETLDGYRLVLNYSVSRPYTAPVTGTTPPRVGAITLDRVAIDPATGAQTTAAVPDIYYVLRSGGANGNGAFDVNGNLRAACGTTDDSENCDMDALFRESPTYDGNNARRFDDEVLAVAWSPASIWAYSDDSPGAIYNTNTGSVGIGTRTPSADVQLDVAGDVRAQELRSTQYCDPNGANCFRTQTIAGSGIECESGKYLVGIRNNEPVCETMRTNIRPIACPANQYVVEITAQGVARCGAI